jgi:hypothetical protein
MSSFSKNLIIPEAAMVSIGLRFVLSPNKKAKQLQIFNLQFYQAFLKYICFNSEPAIHLQG